MPNNSMNFGVDLLPITDGNFNLGDSTHKWKINGGLPITSDLFSAKGDIIYASAINSPTRLAIGSNGNFLTILNGIPTWSQISKSTVGLDNVTNHAQVTSLQWDNINKKLTYKISDGNATNLLEFKTNDGISLTAAEKELTIGLQTATANAKGGIKVGSGLTMNGEILNHSNSIISDTVGNNNSTTLSFGGTFTIPTITYDEQGHITSADDITMTMPSNADEKVKQTQSSGNGAYKLLFTTVVTPTSEETYGTYYNNALSYNPNTNALVIGKNNGNGYGTINGYTLADASAKGVTDSTSASAISTGTDLPTERDIYYGLPFINNAHNYDSDTTIYAPTTAGTSNYILVATGNNAAPQWQEVLSVSQGGTGIKTYAIGDILYASAANSLTALAGNKETTRKFLISVATNAGTARAPQWDTLSSADVGLNNVSNNSNLNNVTGFKGDIIYWNGDDTPARLSIGTAGYFLKATVDGPRWANTTDITTLGTITTGTWQGSTIAADYIGSHSTDKLTSGTLGIARGGTGKSTWTIYTIPYASAANTLGEIAANTTSTRKFLRMVGTGSAGAAPAWDTVTKTDVGLSNVSNDSNLNSTTGSKGDIIYWSAANTPAHLTNSSSTTKKFLSITSQVPSWTTLAKGDVGLGNVENTALSTWTGTNTITTVGTIVTGEWKGTAIAASYIGNHSTDKLTSGTLPIGRGGTGTTTAPTQYGVIYASTTSAYASTGAGTSGQYLKSNGTSAPTWATFSASTVGLGNVTNAAQITKATFTGAYQIMYSTAASTPAVLAANTSSTKKFLQMTGTGSAGAAPAWDTLVVDDIPNLSNLYLPRSGGTITNTEGIRINYNDGSRIQFWVGLNSNSQYQGLYSTGYLDSNSTWHEDAGYIIRRINNGKVFIDFPTVIQDDTGSSSKETGALVIQGGLGVAKTIFANNLVITDNNPTIRLSDVDVTVTNNDLAETTGKYYVVGDKNGRGFATFYGSASNEGSATAYLLTRTFNGTTARAYQGIGVRMDSSGTLTYIINGQSAFRNAIGASSGIWPVSLGGTGVTSIANIQAGKDGDGNTISSTYLKLSGGTISSTTGSSSKTTGALVVSGGIGVGGTVYANNAVITSNSPYIKAESVDLTETNNGITSTVNYQYSITDKNNYGFARFYGAAYADGRTSVYMQTRNYNGTTARNYQGLGVVMDNSGEVSYVISSAAAFRKALELGTSGAFPITVEQGGTGVTSIANIKAGKDGDGNTISSTYLKLSGGTLTGALTMDFSGSRVKFQDGTRELYWVGVDSTNKMQGMYSSGYYDANNTWQSTAGYIIRRISNGEVYLGFTTNVINGTSPYLSFRTSSTGNARVGLIQLLMGTTNSVYRPNCFNFRQYSYNASTGALLTGYEEYHLPSVTSGLTSSTTYTILTTKNVRAGTLSSGSVAAGNSSSVPVSLSPSVSSSNYSVTCNIRSTTQNTLAKMLISVSDRTTTSFYINFYNTHTAAINCTVDWILVMQS